MARRKAGDGLIRKRKDGRWEGRVVVGYDENGLPKTKNVLAKTKRECQEKLDKLKASLGTPPKAEKKCSTDMPFGEWLDHWYRTYIQPNVRPGTRENYELRIYKHITPQLGRLPLNKLTQGDLLRFYMHLKRAGRKIVRFHDLRHTFATEALAHGMDVKTLSAVIGHVSAATTLNVYTHVTDAMQIQAAQKIDKGIAGRDAEAPLETAVKAPLPPSTFTATKGKHRKPGTGCVSQISETLWEGRYSPVLPDGKKRPRNIYAHSEEEYEAKLAAMIVEEKAKIAAERERMRSGT